MSDAWAHHEGYDHVVSDERIKKLMAGTAYPDSMGVYQAMKALEAQVRKEVFDQIKAKAERDPSYQVEFHVHDQRYQFFQSLSPGQDFFACQVLELPHIHPDIFLSIRKL